MMKSNTPEAIIESIISPILTEVGLGIALVDSKGTIHWVNEPMVKWFGLEKNLLPVSCEQICQNKGDDCCIDPEDIDFLKSERNITHTLEDGTVQHFHLTTTKIKNSPSDKFEYILMVRKIAEVKEAEKTLQPTEAHFQKIIDSSLAGIVLADLEGKVLYANRASLQIFGFDSVEEVIGIEGFRMFTEIEQKTISETLEQLLSGQHVREIRIDMKKKDGTPLQVRLSAIALMDQDERPNQLLVTLQDISENVQAEKTQEAVYQIASVAGSTGRLEEIYPAIHEIIQGIMPANNFYIALVDFEKQTISFPYFVDEIDTLPPIEVPLNNKSITSYVLRTGKSLLCTQEVSDRLEAEGEVELIGTEPAVWLGSPLVIDHEVIGVIAMQHYEDPSAYTANYQRVLDFVSTEVAKAIHGKRTEHALLESERRFRSIVESSPFGLHLYRLMPNNDLIFLGSNQSADTILQFDNSTVIGKTIEEAFPSLVDTEVPDAYRTVAANGGFWETRQINYQDDNIQGAFDVYAFQVSENEMAAMFVDVTERIQTEAALIEGEKRFRSVVERSPMGIFIYHLTEKGKLIFMDSNPAADEILGFDCKQFVGKTIEEAFPRLIETEIPTIYREIAKGGGVWHTDDIRYSDDSNSSAFEVFAFQISPMRVAVMYQDITNRLQTEEEIRRLNEELEERVARRTAELEAANREMEAFAYSVSHDLRAPVRSIKGFSELLRDDFPSMSAEEVRELLERIYGSSIKMDKLIDDLLSLSYLENQTLDIQSINLSLLVEDICQQMGTRYPAVKFTLDIQETPPTRADRNMVYIMLTNLLTNAYKFTANHPNPKITFGSIQHGGETTYYLQDNGIGFEMEYDEKIFAPFERLHPDEFEGTGIGLAIVRRVVQRHKGRIWAVSKLGEGATFNFSFGTSKAIT